jgi:hypothetical protein
MEKFMTTILLHPQNLEYLKKLAREQCPSVGSSHLSEALASGLGFKKHASLLSATRQNLARLHAVKFSPPTFANRLAELCKSFGDSKSKVEGYSLCPNQIDLPVSCWQFAQSDAVYHRYTRWNLPIIFMKDKKKKYCTLDYDYHSPNMNASSNQRYGQLKNAAIRSLLLESQRLFRTLDMPNSLFDGQIFTGWITKILTEKFPVFADYFALTYLSIIHSLERELAPVPD